MKPYERMYSQEDIYFGLSDGDSEMKTLEREQKMLNLAREVNCIIIHLGDLGKLVLKMNQEIKELQKLHTERVSQ